MDSGVISHVGSDSGGPENVLGLGAAIVGLVGSSVATNKNDDDDAACNDNDNDNNTNSYHCSDSEESDSDVADLNDENAMLDLD